jgi:preprotein translocase subunit SecD
MIESMKGRTVLVILFLLFTTIYLLPNLVKLPSGWVLHKKALNYGLDIQGGAHLVYGVDVKGVMKERTERTARAIQAELQVKDIKAQVTPNETSDALRITTQDPAEAKKVSDFLKDQYATVLQITSESGNTVEARYFDAVLTDYRQQVINQAIEVIRNRVDEFGVAEPIIAAQGTDRILVQLPGITDPAGAKELINKTARLDFHLVDNSMQPDAVQALVTEAEKTGNFSFGGTTGEKKEGDLTYNQYVKKVNETLKGKLPPNTMIAFEKAPQATTMEAGRIAYLLRTDTDISGDQLEDAFMSYGQYGEPKVSFRFGSEGRRKFGDLTAANVNRQLAIVLDQVVYSAPNIIERIDGEGQISLGNRNNDDAMKEGQLIATALRAGALPAALQQLEERTVGPSLGADSIAKGKKAGIVGLMLVAIFVIIIYKAVGVVAAIALSLNVLSLLAILSALGATLTLPGIAGLTLTMGMAVDANVIIFERIKEELARGVAMRTAIKDGFDNAWSAIFDSNVTNAIAAAVLIYFGTGAVRGFGVVLIAGIVTTLITAVFVTHYLLDVLILKFKVKNLKI